MPKHWDKTKWAALSNLERNRVVLARAKEIMRQTRLGALMTIAEAKAVAARQIRRDMNYYK